MCGITGFLTAGGFSEAEAQHTVEEQTRTLMHRGPDDGGTWVDPDAGIALGHRRLSILDLSLAGHQPMVSASGRYVIVLNGEIYNHLDLRARLDAAGSAPRWRGHSDTETLLAGIDQWGIESTLASSVGMYAFAVWDRHEKTLTLVRDRMGEKPLYYGWQGGSFLFGSELKAMLVHPGFRPVIDREVLADYMRRGYIRAPQCIYRDIFKLLPGTYLQLSMHDTAGALPAPKHYWSLREVVEQGRRDPFQGDEQEAARTLEELLGRAVALQSIADVSLGAFLSGGIDSSLIVALMQAHSSKPVKTFTIGFNEPRFNEAVHARAVAEHLGTEHTELYVDFNDAMRVIPRLPQLFDEPFGDSSAIPTYLVSQLARSKVTVSLSGDGGDEIFGGYSRYRRTEDIWKNLRRIPHGLRVAMSYGARAFEPLARAASIGPNLQRLNQMLLARSAQECYEMQFLYHYGLPAGVLGVADKSPMRHAAGEAAHEGEGIFDHMMYEDSVSYLPDDILVKVDRAAMAVSLESRIPMLDHRLVEFAWRLPLHLKVRQGEGKWLLKQVLRRHVPGPLIDREKMGFGVPVGDWVRGPLRDWAEDLVSADRLRRQGILDERVVRGRWTRFLKDRRVGSDGIWQLLMFQSWVDG
ncbi:MAG: asparagine synthase (glutamine-hydrolyzing) [Steroidobacteraceae bacterium]|jgi:asparagine synthase (glutamine-hydrolysing)